MPKEGKKTKNPKGMRPRLSEEVEKLVTQGAAKSGRSIPREVNFALKRYYASIPHAV